MIAHVRLADYVTHQIICPRCGLQRAYPGMKDATRDVAHMVAMGIEGRVPEACACEGLCQCPAN